MIRGRVELARTGDHPILEPRVDVGVASSPGGVSRTVKATVDTGFTAWLTLPLDSIRELGLQYRATRKVTLADGSEPETDLYLAFIDWHGIVIPRLIHQSAGNPLLGLALLTGCRLTVETVVGGEVTIEEMGHDTAQ